MIRWWIARKRAAAWKSFREQYASRSLQGRIRDAERIGDFKFMCRSPWVVLLRRREGYQNTWDFIDQFATRWAARNCAASMVRQSDGILQ